MNDFLLAWKTSLSIDGVIIPANEIRIGIKVKRDGIDISVSGSTLEPDTEILSKEHAEKVCITFYESAEESKPKIMELYHCDVSFEETDDFPVSLFFDYNINSKLFTIVTG